MLGVGAATVLALSPALAEAYLEVSATPHEVRVGDTFTLRISVVQSSENLAQAFATPQLTLPELPHIEVVNYQTQSYRVQLGGRQKMNTEAIYILRAQKAGTLTIPALEQPYQEGNQRSILRSDPVTITVTEQTGGLSQSPAQQPAPTPLVTQTPEPTASVIDPFAQSEALREVDPDNQGAPSRIVQGLLLLGVLFAGVGLGFVLRRRGRQDESVQPVADAEVVILPFERSFPASHEQLRSEPAEVVLATFRRELIDNLRERGALDTTQTAHALSNQEILQQMQKQLVPMTFYGACQKLLKQDEALRYQGNTVDLDAVQHLLNEAEQIFKKS